MGKHDAMTLTIPFETLVNIGDVYVSMKTNNLSKQAIFENDICLTMTKLRNHSRMSVKYQDFDKKTFRINRYEDIFTHDRVRIYKNGESDVK